MFSAVRGGQQQLYLRKLDQLEATPIAGTEGGASPFFSPDGQWVGFWAAAPGASDAPLARGLRAGALKKVALAGGPALTLCETREITGASWGSNETIVFAGLREGLQQVSASGGTPTPLTTLDAKQGEVSHRLPHVLPGGRVVLFTLTHDAFPKYDDDTEIVAQSLATGERTVLIEGGADARYVPAGHLVYVRHGALLAVPFDPDRVAVTGSAVGLLDHVLQAANLPGGDFNTGAAQLSVSDSGSLVYVPGGTYPDQERTLVWVDRAGAVQPLGVPPRPYIGPRLAPSGQRLLVWARGVDRNVWLYELARGTLTRWTTSGQNVDSVVWTPDGTRAAFGYTATAGSTNLFWRRVDGGEEAERLTTSEYSQRPSSWSPDGQTLAFNEFRPTTLQDIWVLSLAGDRRPRPVLQTRFNENFPEFSPDGRWLAYVSNESGRQEVYVQPYPGPGVRQQVSTEGGDSPAWSRDGRELFYVALPRPGSSGQPTTGTPVRGMMAVPVTTQPVFTAGAPKILFEGAHRQSTPTRAYNVTADGRRFLMVQQKDRPPLKQPQMVLVQNWLEELKRRVPSK